MFFLITILCFSCEVSKGPISRIYTTSPYPPLSELPMKDDVYADQTYSRLKPSYSFLDEVDLFTFSYEVEGHIVLGYGARPKGQSRLPTIIYSRGGTYENGRWNYGTAAVRLGELAARGYTVLTYEYGQSINDVAADEMGGYDTIYLSTLIELAGQVPGADRKKIGLYGWSRGGMMTFQALREEFPQVKAAVVGGAPTNFRALLEDRPLFDPIFQKMIPGYAENREEELSHRSAVDFVGELPEDVPILILHGEADNKVRVEQAQELAALLEEKSLPHQLLVYPGGDHGISGQRKDVLESADAWFRAYLK
ncbi:alpha/beta hydrolase family protein [Neolewinella aurantiaca]|uniref:alpha/beta hydrolase family protein n=1 Tax=Neolewinella aurantiaca TaxID=2602767 RepID=UPI0016506691|nr:prolyl oligopeptidase family serine peptidase [Neolewinella aurantiaca]